MQSIHFTSKSDHLLYFACADLLPATCSHLVFLSCIYSWAEQWQGFSGGRENHQGEQGEFLCLGFTTQCVHLQLLS